MLELSENNDQPHNIGDKLKLLRSVKGFSIRVLAEKARLSPNTISLIESNSTSPTVATLQMIANALEVSLASFFTDVEEDSDVVLIKAMNQEKEVLPGVRVNVFPNHVLDSQIQVMHFAVSPNVSSGNDPLIHNGNELVFCIQGQLEYVINNRTYLLKKQDSVVFKANIPHSWCNRSHVETHFIVVIVTEDEQNSNFYHHMTFAAP